MIRENGIVLHCTFSTFLYVGYSICCLCAKYGIISFSLIIRPLFPSFLHHHCIQILYMPPKNVFYLLVRIVDIEILSLYLAHTTGQSYLMPIDYYLY